MTSREIRTRNWSEDVADRRVKPCSSCHVEAENQTLRRRIQKTAAYVDQLQSENAHWEAWQRAVPATENLRNAVGRAFRESNTATAVLASVLVLSIYGAMDLLCVIISALQEVMR